MNPEDRSRALKDLAAALPSMIEAQAITAAILRAKFNALVKEGFSEAQAVELCKGPLV
jgi:hypothetical protein